MRRGWVSLLRGLSLLALGCKTASGPPDDALLLNRHPIEGRIATSVSPLIAYREPEPPTTPWNTRPRTDIAEETPRQPRIDRTVPGVLTNFPKAPQ